MRYEFGLVCVVALLLAVAVHRRKVEDMYKDTDDIRENIINYEDEGGGEGDTAYDMRFLRMQDDDNGPVKCPIIPMTGKCELKKKFVPLRSCPRVR